MSRLHLLIALAACSSLGGCRTALVDEGSWIGSFLAVRDGADDDLLPALRDGLWLVETDYERPYRWRFTAARGTEAKEGEAADASPTPAVWPPLESLDETDEAATTGLDDPAHLATHAGDTGLVGWNAAILLARAEPAGVSPEVVKLLERLASERPRFDKETREREGRDWRGRPERGASGTPIPTAMQAAAAEAWVHVLVATGTDPAEQLAPVGRLLERRDLSPEVRTTLFRTVARWVPPRLLPYVDAAIGERANADPAVRLAVVEACDVHAEHHPEADEKAWPARIDDARWDPDAAVRIAYARWAARTRRVSALATLREQLLDTGELRSEAVESLAVLGTDEAQEELRRLTKRSDPTLRGPAVAALATWGADTVLPFVDDEDTRVRLALARALGQRPTDTRAVRLLIELVDDDSPDVARTAIDAVSTWSSRQAGPVLIAALESRTGITRAAAHGAILRRLPDESEYRPHDPEEDRDRAIASITHRLGVDRTLPANDVDEPANSEPPAYRRARLDKLVAAIHTGDSEEIRRHLPLRSNEWRYVERGLAGSTTAVAERALREVLYRATPVHAALLELREPDVRRRRRAASTVRDAEFGQLTPFVLERLRAHMVGERDRIVWARVHAAVADDGGEEAALLVRLALESQWPDLRALGCEYVARHPRPNRGEWVLPLFREDDSKVLRLAIRAAGRCGHPAVVDGRATAEHPQPIGLLVLAAHRDLDVRIESAIALVRLEHPLGLSELARLTRSPEAEQRRAAYVAIGETAHEGLVESLLTAARDETDSNLRRLALASLERLVDERDRPLRLPPADRAPDAALYAWESWWEDRARRR